VKQSHSSDLVELERNKRLLFEQQIQLAELKRKLSEVDRLREENESFHAQLVKKTTEALGTEQDLKAEVHVLRESKNVIQKQLDSARGSLQLQKKVNDDAVNELHRLRQECEELRAQNEKHKRDHAVQDNHFAELQLQSLKTELGQTVSDFRNAEKERGYKEGLIRGLQMDLAKEKERSSLLKTQVSLLEERLRVSNQELSVYRSLDVYHSSMQSELHSYRISKATPNAVGGFRDSILSADNEIDGSASSVRRETKGDSLSRLAVLESTSSGQTYGRALPPDPHRTGPPASSSDGTQRSATYSSLRRSGDSHTTTQSDRQRFTLADISTPQDDDDYDHDRGSVRTQEEEGLFPSKVGTHQRPLEYAMAPASESASKRRAERERDRERILRAQFSSTYNNRESSGSVRSESSTGAPNAGSSTSKASLRPGKSDYEKAKLMLAKTSKDY
jgi:hypothetical protein